jgi:hypothetical protein
VAVVALRQVTQLESLAAVVLPETMEIFVAR